MLPQVGVGGWTPSPRKLRPASSKIAPAIGRGFLLPGSWDGRTIAAHLHACPTIAQNTAKTAQALFGLRRLLESAQTGDETWSAT